MYYGYNEPVFFALGLATSWYLVGGEVLGVILMFFHGFIISFFINGLIRNANGWRFMLWISVFLASINIEQSFLNNINYAYKIFLIALFLFGLEIIIKLIADRTNHSQVVKCTN